MIDSHDHFAGYIHTNRTTARNSRAQFLTTCRYVIPLLSFFTSISTRRLAACATFTSM